MARGSLILPAQIFEAYAFAYADGYTANFLFAAAFPLGHNFVILFSFFCGRIESVFSLLFTVVQLIGLYHFRSKGSRPYEFCEFVFLLDLQC